MTLPDPLEFTSGTKWYRLSRPFGKTNRRLGGSLPPQPNGGRTTAPSFSNEVYDALPREWPTSALKSKGKEKLPEFYKAFCEGVCEVAFQHSDDFREFTFAMRLPNQEPLLFTQYLFETPKDALLRRRSLFERGLFYEEDDKFPKTSISKRHEWSEDCIRAQLTEEQQARIVRLFSPRFFFEHGAAFCDKHPGPFLRICELEILKEVKKEKVCMAWCLLATDVALTINNDDYLCREGIWDSSVVFRKLGQFLEVQKRFLEAAAVYAFGASFASTGILKGVLHGCAGNAYRECGRFEKSEAEYVLAMHESVLLPSSEGGGFRELSGVCKYVVTGILILYITWRKSTAGGEMTSPAEPWLCKLLARNEFSLGKPANLEQAMLDFYDRKIFLKKLKAQTAKQYLIEVLQCTNVTDYHNKLLELRSMGSKSKATWKPPLLPLEGVHSTAGKSAAQAQFAPNQVLSATYCCNTTCWNTEEGLGVKLMQCSKCLSVSYCSRECQTEHWHNGHKKCCKRKK